MQLHPTASVWKEAAQYHGELLPFAEKVSWDFALLISNTERNICASDLEDPQFLETLASQIDKITDILESSSTVEDLKNNVSEAMKMAESCLQENMDSLRSQLKEIESAVVSLQLSYQNKGNNNRKIMIYPYNPANWLDTDDPSHFDHLEKRLIQEFERWTPHYCPSHLGFYESAKSANGALRVAELAHNIHAMAILPMPEYFTKASDLIRYAEKNYNGKVTGPNNKLANLILLSTNGRVIRDYQTKRTINASISPAFTAKFLSINSGEFFTSLEGSPIIGLSAVNLEYDTTEKRDSKRLGDVGIVQILNKGFVQSTETACVGGDIAEYSSFLNMDVWLTISRALILVGNKKSKQFWGDKQRKALVDQILKYTNSLKREDAIEGVVTREDISVNYTDDGSIFITLKVKFKGVSKRFVFKIEGEKDHLTLSHSAAD
ncbi:MAG: hypothetical protein AAFZ15_31900 [Bacteroidota bacterium]